MHAKEKLEARRADQCCFVIGNNHSPDWHYCPATRSHQERSGRRVAYCEAHYAIMFVKARGFMSKTLKIFDEAA